MYIQPASGLSACPRQDSNPLRLLRHGGPHTSSFIAPRGFEPRSPVRKTGILPARRWGRLTSRPHFMEQPGVEPGIRLCESRVIPISPSPQLRGRDSNPQLPLNRRARYRFRHIASKLPSTERANMEAEGFEPSQLARARALQARVAPRPRLQIFLHPMERAGIEPTSRSCQPRILPLNERPNFAASPPPDSHRPLRVYKARASPMLGGQLQSRARESNPPCPGTSGACGRHAAATVPACKPPEGVEPSFAPYQGAVCAGITGAAAQSFTSMREAGIEPAPRAWHARTQPLSHTRDGSAWISTGTELLRAQGDPAPASHLVSEEKESERPVRIARANGLEIHGRFTALIQSALLLFLLSFVGLIRAPEMKKAFQGSHPGRPFMAGSSTFLGCRFLQWARTFIQIRLGAYTSFRMCEHNGRSCRLAIALPGLRPI